MRRIKGIFILVLFRTAFPLIVFAQNKTGITGKPDTSYTTHSAFANDSKTHPGISIEEEFRSVAVKEERNKVYCEIGQRKLVLDVFSPAQKKNQNNIGVIIIHGGGWRSGNRSQHYPLAQHLAALGYTCFTPEYRLSTEALFPAGVFDIKTCIRWVKKKASSYDIDTARIVAMGFSAGGEMAALMGTTGGMPLFEGETSDTTFTSKVNAVVDIDGTLSFVHPDGREGDDSKRISAATHWFGYSKNEQPQLWEGRFPA
jgi:pectinesterase